MPLFYHTFIQNRRYSRDDSRTAFRNEKVAETRNKNYVFDYGPQALFNSATLRENRLYYSLYFVENTTKIEAIGRGNFNTHSAL
jgi:hypothetical protein